MPTQLTDVNTTDIADAIRLGCRCMQRAFNSQDADIPFFGARVRPIAEISSSSESHVPGRHLNALLNAEDAFGLSLDEDAVDKHARAAFFSYSQAPVPLQRDGQHRDGAGTPTRFTEHNLREGFHALYALAKYRDSDRARELAARSIECINEYWLPDEAWQTERVGRELGVTFQQGHGTFIQRPARAIGPLVKYYRATGHGPALQLALALADKALRECFRPDGSFSNEIFGTHAHSTTCVMSSLAQLADLLQDSPLMARVKSFYDNGLWEMRDQIGWSIEVTDPESTCVRGESNNSGDILETALILGRWGHAEYYADAERILRCHLLPSQLRDVSFVVEPDNPENLDGRVDVADRLRGAFGFPAPYGHEPVGIWQSKKARIGFNLDIVGGAVGSLCEAYREVARLDESGHWVNLLFDHKDDSIEVQSPYTHSHLAVRLKKPGLPLHLRLPPWASAVDVDSAAGTPVFANGYLHFAAPPVDRWLRFAFDLPEREETLTWRDQAVRARFRGDEVTAMENFDQDLTFFDPLES